MMRFFGRRYLAPMYNDAPEVHPPTGANCGWCEDRIEADDDGIVLDASPDIGFVIRLSDGSLGLPYHRECFLRTLIGSVAHVEKRCSCYVDGSKESDPPGMAKREAAKLALKRSYEVDP